MKVQWPPGDRRLFVSTQTYEMGKRLGIEQAQQAFTRETEVERPRLPSARVVRKLRELGTVALFHASSTSLPKLRSRAAHAALQTEAEYWVMIDDDVECDMGTLQRMLTLAGPPEVATLVALPCLLRGIGLEKQSVNVKAKSSVARLVRGELAFDLEQAGCGLLIVTRNALQTMSLHLQDDLRFIDDDGAIKVALFAMELGKEGWFGEDLSFTRRAARMGIPIYAPASGVSDHDGHKLDLSQLR